MKENLVKAENKTSYIVTCIIGILFFLFLTIMIGSKYQDAKYEGISILIGFAFFLICPGIFVYALIKMPQLYYNSMKVEFRTIFGRTKKTILLADITGWVTQQKKSKNSSWENLIIITKDQKKHKLHSYHYSDYERLKRHLTNGKKKDEALKKELDRKEIIQYATVTFGIAILFFGIASYLFTYSSLKVNQVQEVKGVLSEDIHVEKHRRSETLHFYLENYPKMNFEIRKSILAADYEQLLQDYKKGNSISFKIKKDDFQKKLQPNQNLNFIEKYWNPFEVEIVELKDQNNTYLTLESYNQNSSESNYSGLGFVLFIGILFLFISAIFYKNRNKVIN
ncbi:hypothetical protein ACFSJW_08975 [Flavobacterium artemisiae]|uniref:Exocyst complex component EXOC2/Sec5 N-terminal domain-containing protein n=1 Tax=Flavobacterium artemisiae TaxID=2126556 RepID=A0ABW4HF58_9FLAO